MHAWYSAKAAKQYGSVFYNREDGTEVEVTLVCTDPHISYGWDDKVYMGEVAHFNRDGQKGTNDGHKNIPTHMKY